MPHPLLARQPRERWAETIADVTRSGLPGALEIEILELDKGRARTTVTLRNELMLFADGPIHAGTVFGLADTCAGWGCLASLPEYAEGFTTIEAKTNFLATAKIPDRLECAAALIHAGRTTQVWDAVVSRISDGRDVGVYRCTQALLSGD